MATKGDVQETRFKTYVAWSNFFLAKDRKKIVHFPEDLKDGSLLCELLKLFSDTGLSFKGKADDEALSEEDVRNNFYCALEFLKNNGSKQTVPVDDLVAGDADAFDNLFKEIIYQFQLQKSDLGYNMINTRLLTWANENDPKVSANNFAEDFEDGKAFCAIISQHNPVLFRYKDTEGKSTEELLKLALDDSVINLAIPKVLSSQDVLDGKIDTISVITFIGLLKYKTYDQSSSKRSSLVRKGGRKGGRGALSASDLSASFEQFAMEEAQSAYDDSAAYGDSSSSAAAQEDQQQQEFEGEEEAGYGLPEELETLKGVLREFLESTKSETGLQSVVDELEKVRQEVQNGREALSRNDQQFGESSKELQELLEQVESASSKKKEAEEKIQQLQQDQKQLLEELESLKSKSESSEKEKEDAQKDLDAKRSQLKEVEEENTKLAESLQAIEAKVAQLNEEKESLSKNAGGSADAEGDVSQLEKQKAELAQNIDDLQKSIEEKNAKIASASDEEKALAEQITSLQAKLSDEKKTIQELADKKDQLEKVDIPQLESKLTELKTLLDGPSIDELNEKIALVQQEIKEANERIELENALKESLSVDHQKLETRKSELSERVQSLEASLKSNPLLKDEISSRQKQHDSLKKSVEADKSKITEVQTVVNEMEEYNKKLIDEIDNLFAVCGPSLEEIQRLEDASAELSKELEISQEEFAELDETKASNEKKLEKFLAILGTDHKNLRTKLQDAEAVNAALATEKQKLQAEVDGKKQSVEQKRLARVQKMEQIDKLKELHQSKQLEAENNSSDLSQQLSALELTKSSLEAEIKAIQSASSSSSSDGSAAADEDNEDVDENTVEKLKKEIAEFEQSTAENRKLQGRIAELEAAITRTESTKAQLIRDKEESAVRLAAKKAQTYDLRREARNYRVKLEKLKSAPESNIEDLQASVDGLQAELAAKESDLEALRSVIKSTFQKVDDEVNSLLAENAKEKKSFEIVEVQVESLKEQQATLSKKIKEVEKTSADLSKKYDVAPIVSTPVPVAPKKKKVTPVPVPVVAPVVAASSSSSSSSADSEEVAPAPVSAKKTEVDADGWTHVGGVVAKLPSAALLSAPKKTPATKSVLTPGSYDSLRSSNDNDVAPAAVAVAVKKAVAKPVAAPVVPVVPAGKAGGKKGKKGGASKKATTDDEELEKFASLRRDSPDGQQNNQQLIIAAVAILLSILVGLTFLQN